MTEEPEQVLDIDEVLEEDDLFELAIRGRATPLSRGRGGPRLTGPSRRRGPDRVCKHFDTRSAVRLTDTPERQAYGQDMHADQREER